MEASSHYRVVTAPSVRVTDSCHDRLWALAWFGFEVILFAVKIKKIKYISFFVILTTASTLYDIHEVASILTIYAICTDCKCKFVSHSKVCGARSKFGAARRDTNVKLA